MASTTSWRPLLAPLAFAGGALLLTRFITDRPEEAAAMARGIAGPTTWPTMMLWAVLVFALGWAVQRLAQVLRQREQGGTAGRGSSTSPSANAGAGAPAVASGPRVWFGILLVLAYGFGLPWLGFALMTLAYILLWLLLGGLRKPLQLVLIPIIGTLAFLYFFVKVALMPLDRGVGAIGELSVALYRLLGIY